VTDVEKMLAVSLLLSLLSGTGVFLLGVREYRIKPNVFNFTTELVLALITGLTAYFFARQQGLDEIVIYLAVLVASNNWRELSTVFKERLIAAINGVFGSKGGSGP